MPRPRRSSGSLRAAGLRRWRRSGSFPGNFATLGLAFTLRLSSKREKELFASSDPARLISQKINRALKVSGFSRPRYAFVLETAAGRKLHLHGVLILDNEGDQNRFATALKQAGDRIAGFGAGTQLKLKSLDCTWRKWVTYCAGSEELADTSDVLGTRKIVFLSQPLKRLVLDDLAQRQPNALQRVRPRSLA